MAPFKQSASHKYHDYMIQLIHKLHDAEEMLISGNDRHLDELREIADMIEQYVNEAKGHKFEPMPYKNMQGNPQGQQAFFDNRYTDYPEYPQMPYRNGIGYVPYRPFYPIYNERGSRRGEGYNNEDRRR